MEGNSGKYLSIKEASVAYEVSRTKIHRLVKSGAVRSSRDPRDDRITLVRVDDLDSRFRGDTVMDMNSAAYTGVATADRLNRMNAIRASGSVAGSDSTDILRAQRETRSRELDMRSAGSDAAADEYTR